MMVPSPIFFLLIFLLILFIASFSTALEVGMRGMSIENPVLDVSLVPIAGFYLPYLTIFDMATNNTKKYETIIAAPRGLSCERVAVSGLSRLKIGSLHSIHRITLLPSVVIPHKLHSKIQICFHRNSSLGACQCEEDDWISLHKGVWSTIISPYEDRYIDLKFMDDISGAATVTVDVEFQRFRLFCLALGVGLWLLAPIVSSWVPFYYSSSMAIGVLLVVIILIFQVTIFPLVFLVLAGAGLGYWIVKKFVVSEDGTVDVGIAQFVKWAIRIIAVTSIFQSTCDTPLATALVCCCMTIRFLVTSIPWSNFRQTLQIPFVLHSQNSSFPKTIDQYQTRQTPMSTITTDFQQFPFDTHSEYNVHIARHTIHTLLTFCPQKVNEWLTKLQSTTTPPLLIGLDIEWRPNSTKNQNNPAATLQLCVSQTCLIFQLLYCTHFPQQLLDFLAKKELTFVGVRVEEDVEKLVEDYGFRFGGRVVDLRGLASEKRGERSLKQAGLKELARVVLGLEVEKPKWVAWSRWDQEWLCPAQVKYACIDAFLSYEIGRVLGASG